MPLHLVLLVLAIVAVWLPPLHWGRITVFAWHGLLLLALVAGVANQGLTPLACVWIAILFVLAQGACRSTHRLWSAALAVLTGLMTLALALHLLPGFNNPSYMLGDAGVGAAKRLSFDKGVAGLILLGTVAPRTQTLAELRALVRPVLLAIVGTVVLVLSAALALGIARMEPKWPLNTHLWLLSNLFLTCVAEEAFFRGLLQERIHRAMARATGVWVPAIVSAVLFGLVHAGGGVGFVIVATLAGLGYALAYAVTRRMEAPILVHFSLNAVVFLGFTSRLG